MKQLNTFCVCESVTSEHKKESLFCGFEIGITKVINSNARFPIVVKIDILLSDNHYLLQMSNQQKYFSVCEHPYGMVYS